MRYASSTAVTLGTLAFWVGTTLARRAYPSEYDWRYITISSLVYAERNPGGFLWARAGILLCGITGLYWTSALLRRWRRLRETSLPSAIPVLALGFLCMTCCALVPEGRFRVPRAHDFLALAAFVAICAGLALLAFSLIKQTSQVRNLPGTPRLYAVLLAGFLFSPIVVAAVAQAYVAHALPGLPWVGMVWRERGVPVYLSFAFWEWVACAVFSLYLVVLAQATESIETA